MCISFQNSASVYLGPLHSVTFWAGVMEDELGGTCRIMFFIDINQTIKVAKNKGSNKCGKRRVRVTVD